MKGDDGQPVGIELNTVQVVSSMGAAVTGAILTSYLGDGGTIVGTAVGAGASTTGFAVYKHYLARTKEKVAPVIVEHARQWSPVTGTQASRGTSPGAPGQPGGQGTAARTAASPGNAPMGATVRGPTSAATPARPRIRPGPGTPADRAPGTRATPGPGGLEQADTQTMRSYGTVRMSSAGHDGGHTAGRAPRRPASPVAGPETAVTATARGPGKHGQASGGIVRGLRDRPRWVVMVATSAAVFLVAMLVITLIEFGTGKPIDASVWGRNSSGTTLGNVTGSHGSNSKSGTVTPTVSPTPTQSATPGGVGQTAPQPTSSATTAPTPSSVPSVSTAPSQNAPASVAPTGQSQQAPGQQAPASRPRASRPRASSPRASRPPASSPPPRRPAPRGPPIRAARKSPPRRRRRRPTAHRYRTDGPS